MSSALVGCLSAAAGKDQSCQQEGHAVRGFLRRNVNGTILYPVIFYAMLNIKSAIRTKQ